MGTDLQYGNNNSQYYNGRITNPPYTSYPQPQPQQQHQLQNNFNHLQSSDLNSSANEPQMWLPATSSNSSQNASPSSSVNSSGCGAIRNHFNSNYYLPNFNPAKNNWEFMNHVHRQLNESYAYNPTMDTANASSSSLSSSSTTSGSSLHSNVEASQYSAGGSHRRSAGHPYPNHHHHQHAQQHHYVNQPVLQVASGSSKNHNIFHVAFGIRLDNNNNNNNSNQGSGQFN